jgi:hypothetical protein
MVATTALKTLRHGLLPTEFHKNLPAGSKVDGGGGVIAAGHVNERPSKYLLSALHSVALAKYALWPGTCLCVFLSVWLSLCRVFLTLMTTVNIAQQWSQCWKTMFHNNGKRGLFRTHCYATMTPVRISIRN